MVLGMFAAGAAVALLALRLLLGVINYISSRRRSNASTVIVLGSGGHTAEMLALLQGFDLGVYRPRCYVTAATDDMSGQKAAAFEAAAASAGAAAAAAAADVEAPLSSSKRRSPGKAAGPLGATTPHKQQVQPGQQQAVRRSPRVAAAKQQQRQQQHQYQQGRRLLPGARSPDSPAKRRRHGEHYTANQQQYSVLSIPRSREVGQSFLSSVPSTLRALWAAVAVVLDHQPDLVLVNGPGTCIPIAAAALLLRLLGLCGGRVVYVESIARVYRLSLSGKILYHSRLAHTFFVQWEELLERYPRAVYAGRLM